LEAVKDSHQEKVHFSVQYVAEPWCLEQGLTRTVRLFQMMIDHKDRILGTVPQ